MDIRYYLAIPYIAEFEAFEDSNGEWWYQAEYPELEGTQVRCSNIVDAVNELETVKFVVIKSLLEQDKEPPIPRLPLRSGVCGFRESY